MKLKTILKTLDETAAREIGAFWEFPEPSPDARLCEDEERIEYLYPRLQNAAAFRAAYEKLDNAQRNLVSFLAIHGGIMEYGELRRRFFGGDREAMAAALEILSRRGFVFSERWEDLAEKPRVCGLPEPYLRFIDLPYFWQGYLGALLREQTREQLVRLAANGLRIADPPQKTDYLVYEIRRALTDPERARAYIDSLPEDQREVFFLLLQRRGVCLYRDLADMVQKRRPELGRANPIERLLASGLLFQATDNPQKLNNLLRVPRDLYYIVTNHFVRDNRGLETLDAIGQVDRDQQPRTIYDNGISILRDAIVLVGYVGSHSVRRLGNGGIGKNDLKKILPLLSANKTLKYAQFLAYYCIHKKYLVPTGDHWSVSSAFPDALGDSRAFYTDLYATWRATNDWNEEFIDGDCLHADAFPTNLVNIVELRKLVLQNLARIPFDTWIIGPRFIESLLSQIEVQIPHRGSRGRLEKHNRINYLVIETVLCESLYWLGLVTLGLHEDSGFQNLGNRPRVEPLRKSEPGRGNGGGVRLDHHVNFNPRPFLPETSQFHFQITGLGRSMMAATFLDAETRPREANSEAALPFRDDLVHFTVLPNHDVVAPPDLNLRSFYELARIAEIRSIDVVSLFTITQASIRAAMDQGKHGEEILHFLQEGYPSGLAETVSLLVRECGNRYGEIVMGYAGGYIRVGDPVVLEDLRNNKTLAPLFKDIPSDHILLLNRSADVVQAARDLQKCGFMPQIDNENVYASAEGRLRFALTPEDLCGLLGILKFVLAVENELGVSLTDDKAQALFHSLRPSNHAQSRLQRSTDVLSKGFEKNFHDALKRKLDAVTRKYRKQMNEFLAQKAASRERAAYSGANPATAPEDIRNLVRFAIDNEAKLLLRYVRTTRDEIEETVRPESLNNDKVFAFCEDRQSYCAYRLSRILLARLS